MACSHRWKTDVFPSAETREKKSYEIITFANPDSALVFHHEEQFVWLFEIVASGFVNSS